MNRKEGTPHAEAYTTKSGGVVELETVTSNDNDILGKRATSLEQAERSVQLTEEELAMEKVLKKKIDYMVMPCVITIYLLNYIDRNNYAAARLQGLPQDIGLTPAEYEAALSILFVGYVLMQVPSNLLLNFCGRPSYYLGAWTIAWGVVSAATSQVKNYGDMVACRFLLGFVEAPFFAGVLFYLSKWYTRKELSFRMSLFFSGALLAGAFGNLLAGGILRGLQDRGGLYAWQWLYIIEGSLTVCIGIIVCLILPDFPETWRLLTPELRHVAQRRMALDAAETDVNVGGAMSQLEGAKLAFKDPKVYVITLMYHCIVGATGVTNFFPTLTKTLGYSDVISLLLVAPPYIFITFYTFVHSHYSDKLQHRFWFFVYPLAITIVGCLIFMFTDSFGARYFALFLTLVSYASFGIIFAMNSNAIARPPAKRATALSFMNSIGNMASIWTPYTYTKSSAPYYRPAMGVVIGLCVIATLGAVVLRWQLQKDNRELERLEDMDITLTEKELVRLRKTAEVEGIDLATARQLQKGHRYII